MLRGLAEDPAFGEVAAPVLQRLVGGAEIRNATKGEAIYDAGEQWAGVGFVIGGSIAMLAHGEEEKDHLYEQANPGDFFGVSAMFDGGAEMARTIVVSSKARYAMLNRT